MRNDGNYFKELREIRELKELRGTLRPSLRSQDGLEGNMGIALPIPDKLLVCPTYFMRGVRQSLWDSNE
jgi:hypothetical protein